MFMVQCLSDNFIWHTHHAVNNERSALQAAISRCAPPRQVHGRDGYAPALSRTGSRELLREPFRMPAQFRNRGGLPIGRAKHRSDIIEA